MKNLYTQNFMKAVEKNPERFEVLLKSIVESPFQSECGSLWINVNHAEAVCTDILDMANFAELPHNFDYEEVSRLETTLLKLVD